MVILTGPLHNPFITPFARGLTNFEDNSCLIHPVRLKRTAKKIVFTKRAVNPPSIHCNICHEMVCESSNCNVIRKYARNSGNPL